MRDIKFRAWVTDGKDYSEMYHNVQNHIGEDFGFVHMLQNTVNGLDCKVMQYTGLKDKNGVEIYEGDIVEVCDRPCESVGIVKFSTKNYAALPSFGVHNKKGESLDFYYGVAPDSDCIIIGNIYENPELLGE